MGSLSFRGKIEETAQWIANTYHLPFERVLSILIKTVCLSDGTSLKNSDLNTVQAYERPKYTPSLIYVLQHLANPEVPEKPLNQTEVEVVLNLFEQTDTTTLATRIDLYEKLSGNYNPLFNRNELIDVLNSFSRYLESNKSFLLKHGIPKTNFYQWPWLDDVLKNLYPTRALNLEINDGSEKGIEMGLVGSNKYGVDYDGPVSEIQNIANSDVPFPIFARLDPDDKRYLIRKRSLLFDIKYKIINEYVALLSNNETKSLWPVIKEIILSSCLSKDDINRLIKLDEVISDDDVFDPDTIAPQNSIRSGGLQDILLVVTRLEDQINGHWIPDIQKLMTPFIYLDEFKRPRINFKKIYARLGDSKQNAIDQASTLYNEWQVHQYEWRMKFLPNALDELTETAPTIPKLSMPVKETSDTVTEGPFNDVPNKQWEYLTINFSDDENVKIKCKGSEKTITTDYKKMGFENTI